MKRGRGEGGEEETRGTGRKTVAGANNEQRSGKQLRLITANRFGVAAFARFRARQRDFLFRFVPRCCSIEINSIASWTASTPTTLSGKRSMRLVRAHHGRIPLAKSTHIIEMRG